MNRSPPGWLPGGNYLLFLNMQLGLTYKRRLQCLNEVQRLGWRRTGLAQGRQAADEYNGAESECPPPALEAVHRGILLLPIFVVV